MKRTEWYRVLEAKSVKDLEAGVNEFISENGEAWQPIGGVCVQSIGQGSFFFTQALRFTR